MFVSDQYLLLQFANWLSDPDQVAKDYYYKTYFSYGEIWKEIDTFIQQEMLNCYIGTPVWPQVSELRKKYSFWRMEGGREVRNEMIVKARALAEEIVEKHITGGS